VHGSSASASAVQSMELSCQLLLITENEGPKIFRPLGSLLAAAQPLCGGTLWLRDEFLLCKRLDMGL